MSPAVIAPGYPVLGIKRVTPISGLPLVWLGEPIPFSATIPARLLTPSVRP